jgi:hypothetical protein
VTAESLRHTAKTALQAYEELPASAHTSGMVAAGVVVGAIVETDCARVSIGDKNLATQTIVRLLKTFLCGLRDDSTLPSISTGLGLYNTGSLVISKRI